MGPKKEKCYQVVEAFSIAELERKVHHEIYTNGWALWGSPTIQLSDHHNARILIQAMVEPRLAPGGAL